MKSLSSSLRNTRNILPSYTEPSSTTTVSMHYTLHKRSCLVNSRYAQMPTWVHAPNPRRHRTVPPTHRCHPLLASEGADASVVGHCPAGAVDRTRLHHHSAQGGQAGGAPAPSGDINKQTHKGLDMQHACGMDRGPARCGSQHSGLVHRPTNESRLLAQRAASRVNGAQPCRR